MEQIMTKAAGREARGGSAETPPAVALTELRVRTISGREFILPAAPADTTPAEIVDQLVQQGVVDAPPAEQAHEMALGEGNGFRRLDPAQSLEAAGVPSGATLLLVSNAPGAALASLSPIGVQATAMGPAEAMGVGVHRSLQRLVIRRVKPGPPPVEPEPTPRRIEASWTRAAMRVYVAERALDQVWRAVGRCPRCGRTSMRATVERGGALVGRYATTTSGKPFVVITDAIPADNAPASSHFINIRVEDWLEIMHRQLTELPGRQVLGWYHSQPGLGVRMSWVDLRTQRSLFGADWQLALVLDPLTGIYRFYRGRRARRVRWLAFVDDAETTGLEDAHRAGCQGAIGARVTGVVTETSRWTGRPMRRNLARETSA